MYAMIFLGRIQVERQASLVHRLWACWADYAMGVAHQHRKLLTRQDVLETALRCRVRVCSISSLSLCSEGLVCVVQCVGGGGLYAGFCESTPSAYREEYGIYR